MSTKSKKRWTRRYRVHKKPTEGAIQKVLRAQRSLLRAIEAAPSGVLPGTPRVREGWKRLAKAERESR
jgi:hypothetical protein